MRRGAARARRGPVAGRETRDARRGTRARAEGHGGTGQLEGHTGWAHGPARAGTGRDGPGRAARGRSSTRGRAAGRAATRGAASVDKWAPNVDEPLPRGDEARGLWPRSLVGPGRAGAGGGMSGLEVLVEWALKRDEGDPVIARLAPSPCCDGELEGELPPS